MENKGLFQKLLALFIILLIPVFIIANFSILRSRHDPSVHFSTNFIPQEEYLTEKTFVFVLHVNNDDPLLEQNIQSIFNQKYDHYKIILLCSENHIEHLQKIKQLAAKENKIHLITFMKSGEKIVTLDTFCRAIQSCGDDEIIIQLDSNDWLAHEHVLTRLNETHSSSPEVWLTYSQYLEYPSYRKGDEEPYLKRMLRNRNSCNIPYLSAHFKTYYAGLFKQIKPDLKETFNRPLEQESLELYILPMVEVSKNHIRFIDDVLYIHNISVF